MSYNQKSALLFQLVMRHSYFSDGLAKGLTVAPTAGCQGQLTRFNGLYVADEGGGFVGYAQPIDAAAGTPPKGLPDNLSLAISLQDPRFPIYTEIDSLARSLVWYSNNLGSLASKATGLQALPCQPTAFQLNFGGSDWPAQLGGNRNLKISRLNGQVVINQNYYQLPNDSICKVNMAGWSDGAYVLQWTVEGKKQPFTYTFFKWDAGMQPPMFGFFEWYAQGKKPSPIGQAIQLDFEARQTLWQYYLVSRSGHKVKNPSITISGGQTTFVQTGQMLPLPNGSYATCISSTHPLPLQERPAMEITLFADGIRKGMALPYAAPNILYDSGPGGRPSSRIYVYF